MSVGQGQGRLPDFIVIGAMKSGTTSLYATLGRHPRIFMSRPKEPGFFSRDPVYARGLDWYRSLFASATSDQLCGEASTCYSRWPHFGDVAGRMAQDLPDVKLVYVMRHPVDRAYSHYVHLMHERVLKETGPVISFDEAIESIPEIVDASRYLMQIERFHERFEPKRLFLLLLDDLWTDSVGTLGELSRFLELPGPPLRASRAGNRAGDRIAVTRTEELLDRLRESGPVRMVPKTLRGRARALLTRPRAARVLMRQAVAREAAEVSPFDPEIRRRLVDRLAEPTRKLGRMLGRDLSAWSA